MKVVWSRRAIRHLVSLVVSRILNAVELLDTHLGSGATAWISFLFSTAVRSGPPSDKSPLTA